MTTSESTKGMNALQSGIGGYSRYHLGNRWVLLTITVLALAAIAALNWTWLVAAGVASVLLSVLPCLVMCGLGLCMSKMIGGQHASQESKLQESQLKGESVSASATTGPSAAHLWSCCQSTHASPPSKPADNTNLR
jgi:hypothetical protein